MSWLFGGFQELWCCGRRSPGLAPKSSFGPLALESSQPSPTSGSSSAQVYTPTAPASRQSWINAPIEQEQDLNENTRRKTRMGTVSNVVSLTVSPPQHGATRATMASTSTLGVPTSSIRGTLPQQQCDDFGIGPQVLLIPDIAPSRKSTGSASALDDRRSTFSYSAVTGAPCGLQETVEELRPDTRRKSLTGRSVSFSEVTSSEAAVGISSGAWGESPVLQETVEDLRPDTRRKTLSGTSVSFTGLVSNDPSLAPLVQGGSDFGIGPVDEKVEVLSSGVRRTTRKSTVSSMHSLQAIREVPEEPTARTSASGGDFGIQLNSVEEAMRELQELERQVEVVARKEKENRLTEIRYQVKVKAPFECRRNSAPGILLGASGATQTELARKRERAKTTIRFADQNGGAINFAELAKLAAEGDDEDEEEDDYDDEAEREKIAAAQKARMRQHTVNYSGAGVASNAFEARRRFQTIGPGSANSLKPRGSISGPINPFASGLSVGRRHTTYGANKTSRELSEILKLVPLKKVKVIESLMEWDEEDDDDKERGSPVQLYEDAQRQSQAREKRLTFACMALEQEQAIGDAEVAVVEAQREWIGDDSDEEVDNKFEESVVNKRETRRTMAQVELMKDLAVADAEVEVVAETSEWAGADSDDDEDHTKQAAAMRDAREKRLTIAETVLQLDQVVPDAEVEVMEEAREWAGGGDIDDEEDGIQREKAAALAFQAREKRLTVAMDELQKEEQLADAELPVKTEEKEWGADLDSDEDLDDQTAEDQHERHSSATFNAREKRLTIAAEELAKETIVADLELEVKEEGKEWNFDAESDEDIDTVREKRNVQAFETREKRLTMATEMLDNEAILGDAEMVVKEEAKEWLVGGDSDEETSFDKLATRASVSYQAREQRITMSELALKQEGLTGDAESEIPA